MHALTDGAPQLVHLWGWQFRGKDTGYPAINVVDERIGGYDGMMRLMERTKSLNTTLSLSDNYDDAYRSSPAWDEEMIARKPDGDLWKSREWTGEESYIQGLAKYMEGPGVERVRYTCERYKLPGTIHVDVLSYYAIRNDWDVKRPASGIRNLYAGRYARAGGAEKHGVDVSVGRAALSVYREDEHMLVRRGGPTPLSVRRQARPGCFADHIAKMWGPRGQLGRSVVAGDDVLRRGAAQYFQRGYPGRADAGLVLPGDGMPWSWLHMLNVEGFERAGEQTTTTCWNGSGNQVSIDWEKSNLQCPCLMGWKWRGKECCRYCPRRRPCCDVPIADGPSDSYVAGWMESPGSERDDAVWRRGRSRLKFSLDGDGGSLSKCRLAGR